MYNAVFSQSRETKTPPCIFHPVRETDSGGIAAGRIDWGHDSAMIRHLQPLTTQPHACSLKSTEGVQQSVPTMHDTRFVHLNPCLHHLLCARSHTTHRVDDLGMGGVAKSLPPLLSAPVVRAPSGVRPSRALLPLPPPPPPKRPRRPGAVGGGGIEDGVRSRCWSRVPHDRLSDLVFFSSTGACVAESSLSEDACEGGASSSQSAVRACVAGTSGQNNTVCRQRLAYIHM